MIKDIDNFLQKLSERCSFLKNPRIKFWGVFLIIIGFVLETPLRGISHFLADGLLFIIGRDIVGPGSIIDKLFSIGAPIMFIYIPATIALWIIIRDSFQKLDWVFGPILIGILIKGGIYGIISLHYKVGEFWELVQQDTSGTLLWFFILTFLISGLVGLAIWFKEIL
jgi:hypothetical protein